MQMMEINSRATDRKRRNKTQDLEQCGPAVQRTPAQSTENNQPKFSSFTGIRNN